MKNIPEITIGKPLIHWMKINRTLITIFIIAGLMPPVIIRLIGLYNGRPLDSLSSILENVIVSVVMTVVISSAVVSVIIWLHKRFPWKEGIFKRFFLETSLTMITACGLVTLLTLLQHLLGINQNLKEGIFSNLLIAIILNSVLVAVTEGLFFFQQWKRSAVEAERFKQESIRAQLESLKNQVNPHFLFNSLNTLSGLIDMDKELSKEFVDNLSTVYRYVLQNKEAEIVSLETEHDFINAYIQLLKKRHGDRIDFRFNIRKIDYKKGIPPMTLQLLVENAVKHNIASRKKPLTIEIVSNNEWLSVGNNLQKKKVLNSTGIGLENIQNRYAFLTDKKIEILESENRFQVKVPLIDFVDSSS